MKAIVGVKNLVFFYGISKVRRILIGCGFLIECLTEGCQRYKLPSIFTLKLAKIQITIGIYQYQFSFLVRVISTIGLKGAD